MNKNVNSLMINLIDRNCFLPAAKNLNLHKHKIIKTLLIIILFTTCIVHLSYCQNYTRPNIQGPFGLQVNSYSGNLFTQRTDLKIPGRDLSVEIKFSYNSNDYNYDYGFGYGWNLNYDQFYKDSSGGIYLQREDGRKDFFAAGSGNTLVAPKGIFDKVVKLSGGGYQLTTKTGINYYFENPALKKLTRIQEPNGNQVTLTYSGNMLSKIADASGRIVNFTWFGPHLQSITSTVGSSTKTISYSYNDASCLTQVKDAAGYSIKYLYGPGRLMSSLTDGNGNECAITFNSNMAVIKLSSCLAEKLIAYNASQNYVVVTDRTDTKTEQTTYSFDSAGKLTSRTGNCCGYSNSFAYDTRNDITKITDAVGNNTIYGYDSVGNLISETDPLQRTKYYTYDNVFNQVTSITDKNGNKAVYKYDTKSNLIETDYPLGIVTKNTYDNQGNRTGSTDGLSNATTNTYDQYGNILSAKDALGNITTYIYDGWGNILTKTDANGHTTTYTYDALSRPLTITDALGGVTKYVYDAHGNVLRKTDANNNQTNYSYDPYDKLIITEDALNAMSSLSYDGLGNLLSAIDANGRTSVYGSDNLNHIVSFTNAAGDRTNYAYDEKGNLTSISYPNGNAVNITYDVLNRITQMTDNLGTISQYTYDANSNKLSQTDGAGNTTTFKYDALNRLIAKTDPAGNSYLHVYDANNNLVKETDRNGNSTTYNYDALNHLISSTDANGAVTTYTYDKAGNQLSVTDANGNTTAYTYDALNRKTIEKFADNITKKYNYDKVNNVISRTDNEGQVTNYTYDKIYRLQYRSYPNTVDSFTYDKTGKMLSANNNNAKESFAYDAANRLVNETLNGKQTLYAYNITANIKTITYPGGRIINRHMNARNQLQSIYENGISTSLAQFTYDGAGQNISRQFVNGTNNILMYNGKGNITGYNYAPAHITDAVYNYDKENNPISAAYNNEPSLSGQYSYDKVNQLTGFTKGALKQSFAYDKVGNRTTEITNGITTTYTVNNMNAYTSISTGGNTITPLYDGNGNVTNDGLKNYAFDIENRIITVNNGSIAKYSYDALGRRTQKITATDTINYYFSGLQVIEERNAKDSLVTSYVWGTWLDDIISMKRNNGSYYYNKNIIGSVLSITDSTGALVERYEYDGFGNFSVFDKNNNQITSSAIGNVYAFAGREYDKETGLYYFRARYYDAVYGRFMERDPLNYTDGLGLYTYTHNMPLSRLDPFGTFSLENVDWCAVLLVGAFIIATLPEDAIYAAIYLISRGGFLVLDQFGLVGALSSRVFWFGGSIAMQEAEILATQIGAETLEMTAMGRILTPLYPLLPQALRGPIWDALSVTFANGARDAIVLTVESSELRVLSTFLRYELPVFFNNTGLLPIFTYGL